MESQILLDRRVLEDKHVLTVHSTYTIALKRPFGGLWKS